MSTNNDGSNLQNGYDRPTSNWACDHADGTECLLGPTGLGVCQAACACTPRKDGDRWACNRPAIRGGACDEGPTPDGQCPCMTPACTPQRTVRSRRSAFAFAAFTLALGVLLVAMNTKLRREFIAPGPLTTKHAQLLTSSEIENRCAACHPSGNESVSTWIVQTLSLSNNLENDSPHSDMTQSDLCLKCHEKTFEPATAKLAHGLPNELISSLTIAKQEKSQGSAAKFQLVSFSAPANAEGELACAACHREHHGSEHDLTRLTNAQCQNCHSDQFHSFESGHPDFEKWPYTRRQRIAFDHATHSGKHFKKENREFSCNECHKQGVEQDVVSIVGYEACADCHEQDIQQSVSEGLSIFKLPTIDTLALDDAGFDVGQWPIDADGEFDGVLPEVMKLLLIADEKALDAFDVLGSDFDFYDADPDDEEQMEAVASLVWSIKRLLHELGNDPAEAWRSRIKTVLNRSLSPASLYHLETTYSRREFEGCAKEWFADLGNDLQLEFEEDLVLPDVNSEAAIHVPSYGQSISDTPPVNPKPDSKFGWHVDLEKYQISYFPRGHSDAFLAALLDLLSSTTAEPTEDVIEDARACFLSSSSIGTCVSCHSVDTVGDNQLVNWHGKGNAEGSVTNAGFTRFSHRQHLIQPSLEDCSQCHQLNATSDLQSAYKDGKNAEFTSGFVSNFHPISKSACIECHNQTSHKDSCTTCHNYHVHPEQSILQAVPLVAERPVTARSTNR